MKSLLLSVLAIACAEPKDVRPQPDPTHDDHTVSTPAGPSGVETQGTHLLGATLDAYRSEPGYLPFTTTHAVDRDGVAIEVTFTGSAALASGTHVGADPYFDGVVLAGPQGAEVELAVVDGGGDIAHYKLLARATSSDPWTDPCDGGVAVPLAGRWTQTGLHVADPAALSFACTDGVAFKCLTWGYRAGGDPTSVWWRAHQACTRMARADYCGDGVSHTHDGTAITIYDRLGIGLPVPATFPQLPHWPPDADTPLYEAAWNDGDQGASCIGRARWQSLPPGGVCPDQLHPGPPDPRVVTTAQFCDEQEPPTDGTGPLLYDASAYQDLALHVWKDGNDLVSTVRGYWERNDSGLVGRAPFPLLGDYTHVRLDAMLLRTSPNPPLPPDGFAEVWLFRRDHDNVIARLDQALPAGFVAMSREGYVRLAPDDHGYLVELKLCHNRDTDDWSSTTQPECGADGSLFERVGTVGWVGPAR